MTAPRQNTGKNRMSEQEGWYIEAKLWDIEEQEHQDHLKEIIARAARNGIDPDEWVSLEDCDYYMQMHDMK